MIVRRSPSYVYDVEDSSGAHSICPDTWLTAKDYCLPDFSLVSKGVAFPSWQPDIQVQVQVQVCVCVCMRACVRVCVRACARVCMGGCACVCLRACMCACVRVRVWRCPVQFNTTLPYALRMLKRTPYRCRLNMWRTNHEYMLPGATNSLKPNVWAVLDWAAPVLLYLFQVIRETNQTADSQVA